MTWRNLLAQQVAELNISRGGAPLRYTPPKVPIARQPLLVIGLGGAGLRVARETADLLAERYSPAQPNPEGPETPLPPGTRVLAIDTDAADLRLSGFAPHECCEIGAPLPNTLLCRELHDQPPFSNLEWLNPNLASPGSHSAPMARQIGRLCLFHHAQKVLDALKAALSQVASVSVAWGAKTLHVAVISSLAGHTGSGIVLDVAYLLRLAARELGLAKHLTVTAYLLLPDLFADPYAHVRQTFLFANAYAAMMELDYWMDAPERFDPFTQTYAPGILANWDGRPFDDCILVGRQQTQVGTEYAKNIAVAQTIIAEHIAVLQVGEDARIMPPPDPDSGSAYDYFRRELVPRLLAASPQCVAGCRGYTVVGAATLRLPWAEILLAEGGLLFSAVRTLFDHQPDPYRDRDFECFLSPLVGDDIRRAFQDKPLPAIRETSIRALRDAARRGGGSSVPDPMADGYGASLRDLAESPHMAELIAAKVGDLEQALLRMFTNPSQGPFYVARFLCRKPGTYQAQTDRFAQRIEGPYDLRSYVEGCLAAAQNKSAAALLASAQETNLARQAYADLLTWLIPPPQKGFLANRFYAAREGACQALKTHYLQAVMARLFQAMLTMLDRLMAQVIQPNLALLEELTRAYREMETHVASPAFQPHRLPLDQWILPADLIRRELYAQFASPPKTEMLLFALLDDLVRPSRIESYFDAPEAVPDAERWFATDASVGFPEGSRIRANLQRMINRLFASFNASIATRFPEIATSGSATQSGNPERLPMVATMASLLEKATSPQFIADSHRPLPHVTFQQTFLCKPRGNQFECGVLSGGDDWWVLPSGIEDRLFCLTETRNLSLCHYGLLAICRQAYEQFTFLPVSAGIHLWEGRQRHGRELPHPPLLAGQPIFDLPKAQQAREQALTGKIDQLLEEGALHADPASRQLHFSLHTPQTNALLATLRDAPPMAQGEAEQALAALQATREARFLPLEATLMACYEGTDAQRVSALIHALLLQRPALVARLDAEALALRELRSRLSRIGTA